MGIHTSTLIVHVTLYPCTRPLGHASMPGIDASHPDLRGAVVEDEGFSYISSDPSRRDWLKDDAGHGTSVAGIIAARVGGGNGIVGVAHGEINYTIHRLLRIDQ